MKGTLEFTSKLDVGSMFILKLKTNILSENAV